MRRTFVLQSDVVKRARRALCAFAVVALTPQAAWAAEPLPVDYFIRQPDTGEVLVSPDGAFLALSRQTGDEGDIIFYALPPLQAVNRLIAHEDSEITSMRWGSPTRLYYSVARPRLGILPPVPTGEIFAADREDGRPVVVHSFRNGDTTYGLIVGTLGGDGRNALMCALERDRSRPWAFSVTLDPLDRQQSGYGWPRDIDSKPTLYNVDTVNTIKTFVEALPLSDATPFFDGENHARVVGGYDSRGRRAVWWKKGNDWRPLELDDFREGTVIPQHLSSDGRTLLVTGTRTDEPTSGLYRVDLEEHDVEKLYGDPQYDIDAVIYDLAGANAVGVRIHADRPEHRWLDPENSTAQLYQALEAAYPGQAVSLTSVSNDQRRAIALVQSDVNPGDYYLVDTITRKTDALFARRSWVDPAKMRPREAFSIKARDGLVLHGYVTRPRSEAGPYPLVVLPHDDYAAPDRWYFDPQVQLLASYGYAVLQVNHRGTTGYGEEFLRAGYGEWGGKVQDDITDATRWAIEQGIAKEGNVCIYGTGAGGYSALMSAAREPGLYACAATYGGVADLELVLEVGILRRSAAGRRQLHAMLDSDTWTKQRSPTANAERISAPVLLMHDERDWRVDPQHAKRMRRALTSADKSVDYIALDERPLPVASGTNLVTSPSGRAAQILQHQLPSERAAGAGAHDPTYAYDRLLDFLARHLRGGSAVPPEELKAAKETT
jgi:dipeptidyl aminopeptidase/acylaminoacyl peptidase